MADADYTSDHDKQRMAKVWETRRAKYGEKGYGKSYGVPFEQRFWSQADRRGLDECWPWIGSRDGKGYGCIKRDGARLKAHRVSLESTGVTIQIGMVVMHSCDNPSCVNPAHLSVGTHKNNSDDKWRKGRQKGVAAINAQKTNCKMGHPLAGENLVQAELRQGYRVCRTCHLAWVRENRRKKAAIQT